MNPARKNILDLVDIHAQKARTSQYDRDVCILAISAARNVVLAVSAELSAQAFKASVQEKLNELLGNYYDSDGEYTSGKSVIGSLLDDIRSSMN